MDSLSAHVVSSAKLPILNPNEFDLWKMRIKQYFLMTDYSLWEVILNGDSLIPTRIVEGILQPVAPTTAEQKLARKNKLKARGTLLMAFPDKHQLKFNSHKDSKTLMKAIEKRFRGNTDTKKVQKTPLKQLHENFTGSHSESLDQIHDRLQKLASLLEIHGVSLSQEDVNLKFLQSLPSEWKTHTLIWRNKADLEEQSLDEFFNISAAVCAKMPMSSLPNVDSFSNAMAMLTMRARKFLQKTGRNLGANGPTSMGFDMSKVECYNCHRKGHFARECRSPKDSRRNGSYDWSYQAEEEPANYALMAFSSSSSSSDNELSPTKPEQDLSHITRPTTPIIEDWVSDYEDESKTKAPQIVPIFVQSSEQVKSSKHSVKLVETSIPAATPKPSSPKPASSGNKKNRKACFVCKSVDHLIKDCDYHAKKMSHPTPRNHEHKGNHKQYALLTHTNPQKHMVPAAVLTQSRPVSITAVRPVSTAMPKIKVTRPRHVNPIVTKSKSPIRRHITRSPSPKTSNSLLRVTAAKAPVVSAAQGMHGTWGNLQHVLKDKGVIDSGCSRHVTGIMSYLSDFKGLNGGYVAFGGDLVRGLPRKVFENDNTCVACKKGKQHRASCKTKPFSFVDQPLYRLHMDLFRPTFVKSLNKKSYCLIVIDDYSWFTWVFFLATKDETSPILKTFITSLENQLSFRVKVIRNDNGTEFKNND
nr:ribonuclease H-like domain-containing protein [Tanacetum cinerariifolium]